MYVFVTFILLLFVSVFTMQEICTYMKEVNILPSAGREIK